MRKIGIIFLFFGLVLSVSAQEDIQAYRSHTEDIHTNIIVPTVVEIALPSYTAQQSEVFDSEKEMFVPSLLVSEEEPVSMSIGGSVSDGSIEALIDGKSTTYGEFAVPEENIGETTVTITTTKPRRVSGVTVSLDDHIALPHTVEVRADGKLIVKQKRMLERHVSFQETVAQEWSFTFTYGQPLRITELGFLEDESITYTERIRFLAQPSHAYRLYLNPDRLVQLSLGERPNLLGDTDILQIDFPSVLDNSLYVAADVDEDGVIDMHDNCVRVANPDQIDINANHKGDACEDFDKDGRSNSTDNCPNIPNRNQKDTDGDDIGDACDGEESRTTEKYPWLPWVGIGIAFFVLIILFVRTAQSPEDIQSDKKE